MHFTMTELVPDLDGKTISEFTGIEIVGADENSDRRARRGKAGDVRRVT